MTGRQDDGFVAFFRRYTKTSLHTVSTVALTAFGMLTFVNRWFAAVALAAYVLPPIVQYFRQPARGRADGEGQSETAEPTESEESTPRTGTDAPNGPSGTSGPEEPAGPGDDADETGKSTETDEPEPEPEWVVADAPTDETLFDAAVTAAGAYAVGEEGVVLARDGGEGGADGTGHDWRVVLSDGPGAESNDLTGVDAVDGGGVWVAGESGAVGRIDPESGRHVDFSAPGGDTNDITAVAAAGDAGTETVLLADGSGRIRRGRYRDGDVAWAEATKPGSGSEIVGVELREEEGYVCDSNDGVFRTTDAGRTFESLAFEAANGTLTDVTAGGDAPLLSDDDGVIHRFDGSRWTPERLAEDPILAVAAVDAGGVAVGDEEVYERFDSTWERASPPAVESLCGVARDRSRTVVVGEAGTVVEKRTGAE